MLGDVSLLGEFEWRLASWQLLGVFAHIGIRIRI